jgi:hypothetical protein
MEAQNYRIVEYKDYFTIEKKGIEPVFKSFLGFRYKAGEKPYWSTVMKKKGIYSHAERFNAENYQFKTKQECSEWLADKEKYPIYHYNILNEPNKSGVPKMKNPPPPPPKPRTIKEGQQPTLPRTNELYINSKGDVLGCKRPIRPTSIK